MEKSTHGEEPREDADHAEAASAAVYRANTRILDPALFSDIAPARGEDRTQAAPTEQRTVPSEPTALRPPAAKPPSPSATSASRPARRPRRRPHLLFVAAAALALASFAVLRLQRDEPPAPTATPVAPDPTSTIGEPSREVLSASSATVVAGSAAGPSAETPAVELPAPKLAPVARKTAGASPTSPAPATAAAATPPAAAGTLVFPND